MDKVEQAHADAAVDAALAQHQYLEDADQNLPEAITNQEELNECVNDWLHALELEELASGRPRDLAPTHATNHAHIH